MDLDLQITFHTVVVLHLPPFTCFVRSYVALFRKLRTYPTTSRPFWYCCSYLQRLTCPGRTTNLPHHFAPWTLYHYTVDFSGHPGISDNPALVMAARSGEDSLETSPLPYSRSQAACLINQIGVDVSSLLWPNPYTIMASPIKFTQSFS